MKKYLFMIAIAAISLAANAQPANNTGNKQDNADANERFFQVKCQEMVDKLELTDDQQKQFIPLYREYNDAMRAVMPKRERGKQEPATTALEEATRIKTRLNGQKAALDVQISYIDKFANVLTAKQLHKFLQIERKIQQKVMSHRGRNHGDGDQMRGKRPPRDKQGRGFRGGKKGKRPAEPQDIDGDFEE